MKAFYFGSLLCPYCSCLLVSTREVKDGQLVAIYLQCDTPICKYYGIKCYAPEIELKEV